MKFWKNNQVWCGFPLKLRLLNLDEVGWSVYEITDYNNVNSGIFNLYWLRFVPNVNELTISGNGDFIIEYKTPVKVGGYY